MVKLADKRILKQDFTTMPNDSRQSVLIDEKVIYLIRER